MRRRRVWAMGVFGRWAEGVAGRGHGVGDLGFWGLREGCFDGRAEVSVRSRRVLRLAVLG